MEKVETERSNERKLKIIAERKVEKLESNQEAEGEIKALKEMVERQSNEIKSLNTQNSNY